MVTYSAAFVAAMIIAGLATPVIRYLALRLGAVSLPGGRNVNTTRIPRLGGVGIAIAWALTLAILLNLRTGVGRIILEDSHLVVGLGVGALCMCLLGAIDDTRGVRATWKLLGQVLFASGAYFSGFQIHAISLPFTGEFQMGALALPVTILWIVGITNAINLIDGLDGLAAGVVFCAAGTNFVVAISHDAILVALMMATLMGALMGFLFYNFNPAKIFMGDSGSYFLGFVIATSSLSGNQKSSTAVALLVPILALGIPIFDTLFSIVRRALERRPIFSPDRGHIHHRILDLGLTHRRTVLLLYSLSVVFSFLAVTVSIGRDWQSGAALMMAVVMIVGLIKFVRFFDSFNEEVAQQPPDRELALALRRHLPQIWTSTTATSTVEDANKILTILESLVAIEEIRIRAESDSDLFDSGLNSNHLQLKMGTGALVLDIRLPAGHSFGAASVAVLELVADRLAHALRDTSGTM